MSYKDVRQILSSVFDSENSALRANLKTEGELLNMVLDESGEKPALRIRLADFQAVTGIIDGEAAVYADLPNPAEHINEIYIVTTSSGLPLINRKQAGMYRSDGLNWNLLDTDLQADKVYYSGTVPAGNVQDALNALKLVSDVNSSSVAAHASNASNPHGVTKTQIGLGNVDNTADTAKPVSAAVQSALDTKMSASAYTLAFGNLDSPLLNLPLKKNLLTAQGQSVCTFTRASAATYTDRYGVLKSVSADTPRFTADGLLIEGASTNLLTYSEQFDNGAWGKYHCSIAANTTLTTDPFGTNLADVLTEDDSYGAHSLNQVVPMTAGTTYTISIFVKAASRSQFRMLNINTGSGAFFDLTNGTVFNVDNGIKAHITVHPGGWLRCCYTFTAVTTMATGCYMYPVLNGASDYTGSNLNAVYIFGAQIEAMPFATSYIPTTTASLSRAADNISVSYAENFPAPSSSYSLIADVGRLGSIGNSLSQYVYKVVGESNRAYVDNAGGNSEIYSGSYSSFTAPSQAKHRIAHIVDASNQSAYVDGVLKKTAAKGVVSGSATLVALGNNGSAQHLFGTISNLRIYDRALTAEEVRLA